MIGPLLKQEIEKTFEIVRGRSTPIELVFLCPEPACGDVTGNRSLNLKTGKTSCWRCNIGGQFLWWAKKLGYQFSSGGEALASVDPRDLLKSRPEDRSILPAIVSVPLPQGFIPLSQEPHSVYARLIGEMAVRKHLELADLVEAGAGFTRIDPLWEPYCIFPVHDYGETVYYQGRTYAEEPGQKTKRFPSNSAITYGAKYWVYNIDELRESKCSFAIVVESILNVLSLRKYFREIGYTGAVPVAVFKHRVSLEQFYRLTRLKHLKEVCLLFDHDAIPESWTDARRFTNRYRITVAEMPAGENNQRLDPNDNVVLAWEVLQKRQPYATWNRFLAHKALREPSLAPENSLAGMRFD